MREVANMSFFENFTQITPLLIINCLCSLCNLSCLIYIYNIRMARN
jgi:hypothetical protein